MKKDAWRIYPKGKSTVLIPKALKDDVKGYLIIKRSGFREIVSATPFEGALRYDDGKYHMLMSRTWWRELVSPDGKKKIPLEEDSSL